MPHVYDPWTEKEPARASLSLADYAKTQRQFIARVYHHNEKADRHGEDLWVVRLVNRDTGKGGKMFLRTPLPEYGLFTLHPYPGTWENCDEILQGDWWRVALTPDEEAAADMAGHVGGAFRKELREMAGPEVINPFV